MFSLSDSAFSPPVTERRLVYVGTTKMRREHTDVGCGPDGTLGVAEIPAGAVVVGSYVAAGSHYVEWVADVDLTTARCCCPGTPTGGKMSDLRRDIASVLNRHSAENGSDTPDFILAQFVEQALAAFDAAVTARANWYGHESLAERLAVPGLTADA